MQNFFKTKIIKKQIIVAQLHIHKQFAMYLYGSFLLSFKPTLKLPAEVNPNTAKTSKIESHELYSAIVPYCSVPRILVKIGIVMNAIPFNKTEERKTAIEAFKVIGAPLIF